MLKEGFIGGGRFRLIRPIGQGGMASVWWAHHEGLDRDVAIKIERSSEDPDQASRFVREAQIVARFHHPNIVSVLDAGVLDEEGCHFLVMELLHGSAFSDRLERCEPLPPEEVLPILIGVCHGLEAAHAAGVVHRDIKPENIFLTIVPGRGMVPKILDFGVSAWRDAQAKITAAGQILGTPAYMSPEQALGTASVTYAADLWAIGVILYEALLGRQPFQGDNHLAIMRRIVDDEPEPMPAWIDDRLRAIVARCLQKDPTRRYPSAAALRADLELALHTIRSRDRAITAPITIPPRSSTMPSTMSSSLSDTPIELTVRGLRRTLPRAKSSMLVAAVALAVGLTATLTAQRPRAPIPAVDSTLGRAARWQAARVIANAKANEPKDQLAESPPVIASPRKTALDPGAPPRLDAVDTATPPVLKPRPRRSLTRITDPGF